MLLPLILCRFGCFKAASSCRPGPLLQQCQFIFSLHYTKPSKPVNSKGHSSSKHYQIFQGRCHVWRLFGTPYLPAFLTAVQRMNGSTFGRSRKSNHHHGTPGMVFGLVAEWDSKSPARIYDKASTINSMIAEDASLLLITSFACVSSSGLVLFLKCIHLLSWKFLSIILEFATDKMEHSTNSTTNSDIVATD